MELTDRQRHVAAQTSGRMALTGQASTGKTTAALARVRHLLQKDIPGQSILVMVPHRGLGLTYTDGLHNIACPAGGAPQVLTLASVARRMVDLFWPLVIDDPDTGFKDNDKHLTFLTLETSQYYMAKIVEPIILKEGWFDSVAIPLPRLYSQILDNMNKAALVGFPIEEITPRLSEAWVGDQVQRRVYRDVGEAAKRFRAFCLQEHLLDYSLQVETFTRHLWNKPMCRDKLLSECQHIIADNIEEDTPVAHDILMTLMAEAESVLIVQDTGGGYRRFLGAAPEGTGLLHDLCDDHITFTTSLVMSQPVEALCVALGTALGAEDAPQSPPPTTHVHDGLRYKMLRYHPSMIMWAVNEVSKLVRDQGTAPSEVAVLAPFLNDTLRFSLETEFERLDIPTRSIRPSRSLRDEPASRTLLTLAALAHPQWGLQPQVEHVASALMVALAIDWPRAYLFASRLYSVVDKQPRLAAFEELAPDDQQRGSFVYGERYEELREFLKGYVEHAEDLDFFLSQIFNDLLARPNFGFYRDPDAARATDALIRSARRFRQTVPDATAREYVDFVDQGVISAQYLNHLDHQTTEAVLLAPAYTFLLGNQPVDYQVWLEVGNQSWWKRLYQPLTHPYVLSREWPRGQVWETTHEVDASNRALRTLVLGLLKRCRHGLYLGSCQMDNQGYEQVGPLLMGFNRVLRWAQEGR